MSLKQELQKAAKFDSNLQRQIARLPEEQADTSLMSVFIRATAELNVKDGLFLDARGKKVAGITMRAAVGGGIYTATADLRGLKALNDDRRIVSLGGGQIVRPA